MRENSSRDIPLSELYSNLQLEYISYFLRSKIYSKEFAESYKTICVAKKEKIDKIAYKNGLLSIFNDPSYKARYIAKFLNKSGIPNFSYRDEVVKKKMGCWDAFYFFQKGTSVKFDIQDTTLVGIVSSNDKRNNIVIVDCEDGAEREFYYDNVARMFSEDYFSF